MVERESESKKGISGVGNPSRPRAGKYRIGDHPGIGTYICMTCREDWTVTIKDNKEQLPACQKCGEDEDVRYERVFGPEPLSDDLVK